MAATVSIPAAVFEMNLSPLELALYTDLVYLAGGLGGACAVGYDRLAERRRVSRGTVRVCCANLESLGLLQIEQGERKGGASGPTIFAPLRPMIDKDPERRPSAAPAPPLASVDPLALSTARTLALDTLWRSKGVRTDEEIEAATAQLQECRTVQEVEAVLRRAAGG